MNVTNCIRAMVATLVPWAVKSEFTAIFSVKLSYDKGVTYERSIVLGVHRAVSISGQFWDVESIELAPLIMHKSALKMSTLVLVFAKPRTVFAVWNVP